MSLLDPRLEPLFLRLKSLWRLANLSVTTRYAICRSCGHQIGFDTTPLTDLEALADRSFFFVHLYDKKDCRPCRFKQEDFSSPYITSIRLGTNHDLLGDTDLMVLSIKFEEFIAAPEPDAKPEPEEEEEKEQPVLNSIGEYRCRGKLFP